jgi:dTDP-4-amino-4,6-dideoxygalactose transaminase
MTTSGGGMLASDDKELIEHARFLSQQAREPVPHYEHTEIGYNYRMSNVLAAIGRGQLKVLDERVRMKRRIFDYYQDRLKEVPGIEFMPEAGYGKCNRWLTVITIRPEAFGVDYQYVQRALENENIESRPVWKPMHLQTVFNCYGETVQKTCPKSPKHKHKARVVGGRVSKSLFDRGLCLPSGTAMSDDDVERVIETILSCRKK